MSQLLVRDVPPDVVAALKARAAAHGRSAEAEHRAILQAALTPARERFWERAERLRAELPTNDVEDSTALLRKDRDSR